MNLLCDLSEKKKKKNKQSKFSSLLFIFQSVFDVPWIVDPGQAGAQLDPTKVSPSDEATMVEPEANFGRAG
ncbi:hypothetical protein IGI04_028339 [Brassica rapa subsp. trilocularis]|nr:hypothetical protein IGI04_028339 [Brassica rapa subsp. trilocularis]